MPTTTTRRGLPVPVLGDPPNLPADLTALANALEFDLIWLTPSTASARPAASLGGRLHHATDTGAISLDLGASWVTVSTGGPFLALAGGTMTGPLTLGFQEMRDALLRNYRERIITVAASAAATTLDSAQAPIWDVTLSANCTFTFNGTDGENLSLILRVPATAHTVTWPAQVKWPGGAAPTLTANTTNQFAWIKVAGLWLPGGRDLR